MNCRRTPRDASPAGTDGEEDGISSSGPVADAADAAMSTDFEAGSSRTNPNSVRSICSTKSKQAPPSDGRGTFRLTWKALEVLTGWCAEHQRNRHGKSSTQRKKDDENACIHRREKETMHTGKHPDLTTGDLHDSQTCDLGLPSKVTVDPTLDMDTGSNDPHHLHMIHSVRRKPGIHLELNPLPSTLLTIAWDFCIVCVGRTGGEMISEHPWRTHPSWTEIGGGARASGGVLLQSDSDTPSRGRAN